MVCSGSSSDAGIELRWAGLTLFTPFRSSAIRGGVLGAGSAGVDTPLLGQLYYSGGRTRTTWTSSNTTCQEFSTVSAPSY
jgi:hypothetical protein